jgi:transcriptional regulator with XRE-family HTH domain
MSESLEWTPLAVLALRRALRMSRVEFARLIGVSAASVRNWEKGQPLLGGSQRLLDRSWERLSDAQRNRFSEALDQLEPSRRVSLASATVAPVLDNVPDRQTPLEAELASEADALGATVDRASVSDERLTQLEAACHWLGIQVVRMPPALLLEQTLTLLRSARHLMEERQPSRKLGRLERIASMLSTIIGEITFNEGFFSLARHWYLTARHTALSAGDTHLADCALAGLAYLDTYGENPEGVIRLLEHRLASDGSATPVVAWLWSFTAKAHAALGDEQSFKRATHAARAVLGDSPPQSIAPGVFSFRPEKLDFYEAAGYTLLRQPEAAFEAATRALERYSTKHSTTPALIRLEQASALAIAGDADEGCRRASEALLGPQTHPGITVLSRAAKFNALVQGGRSSDSRQWRDVLESVTRARSQQPPAHHYLSAPGSSLYLAGGDPSSS